MNIPKAKKNFCKKCKKHAPHKVTQYKTGKASLYAQGEYHTRPGLRFLSRAKTFREAPFGRHAV
ncbi:hypothetical protein N9L76_11070 [bacterium]|nr:hypothetical protein [bacterium]